MGVELTDHARSTQEVAKQLRSIEVYVDRRAHIEELTRIEGMRSWRTRIKRGRAGSGEQAENWEDVEETHKEREAGRNANAQSWDEAKCLELVL